MVKKGTTDKIVWRRFFAFLLDLLLLNVIIVAPFRQLLLKMVPTEVSFLESVAFLQSDMKVLMMLQMIYFIVAVFAFFYFVLLEYSLGQTVGKMLLNLRVVHEKERPGFGRSMVRSIYLVPVFPLSILWLIDIFYLFVFSKEKQRLTEHISKTKVIRVI